MRKLSTLVAGNPRRGLVAALASALALAACGSGGSGGSSNSSSSNARSKHDIALRVAQCMRAHGVTNFPDPGAGGGAIQIGPGTGINPQSPAFQAAQRTCFKLFPDGGPGRGPASEARKQQMLRLAECMRAHGVSAFPDPTSSPPSAPPSGGGLAFGSPGTFLSIPQSLINSPAFQTAAAVCKFPVPGLKGGPKAAPAPG